MIGNKIVEEKTFMVYTGESFVLKLSNTIFLKYASLFNKKGLNFVEQKLGDFVQRQMKKITDILVSGKEYGEDFDKISVEVLKDIIEFHKEKYGEDLTKY
jgi:hypothetical protein